jgi:uncharacterized protein YrrD
MKTSQQMIGLPVVSISDGNEIGKVKSLMINAARGTVDFFVIDSANRSLSGGVIATEKVLGIGADALTILAAEDVGDVSGTPAAIELLQKNVTIPGTRILTRKGSFAGVAGDIHVDEDHGCGIAGVAYIPEQSNTAEGIIPRDAIITFGQNLLVVHEDFLTRVTGQPKVQQASAMPAQAEAEAEPPAEIPSGAEAAAPAGTTPEVTEPAEPEISVDSLFEETPVETGAESLAADRRMQYLRGRRVTRDIVSETGEPVAGAGDLIDDALMERASKAGCLVELVMNNEA